MFKAKNMYSSQIGNSSFKYCLIDHRLNNQISWTNLKGGKNTSYYGHLLLQPRQHLAGLIVCNNVHEIYLSQRMLKLILKIRSD